jgi:hypothetical protein
VALVLSWRVSGTGTQTTGTELCVCSDIPSDRIPNPISLIGTQVTVKRLSKSLEKLDIL